MSPVNTNTAPIALIVAIEWLPTLEKEDYREDMWVSKTRPCKCRYGDTDIRQLRYTSASLISNRHAGLQTAIKVKQTR